MASSPAIPTNTLDTRERFRGDMAEAMDWAVRRIVGSAKFQ
jgi:hypothetical protein